jgi:multidrug resistance efflux pump
MMAAIFITYMSIVWLVFDKLRLIRLSLPLALVLAAVGPLFAFYILLSMNNYHPSSADARVFQRIVQITPHITAPGRVQEVVAQPNTPMKQGEVLFRVDPEPFQYEVSRLEAALAAAEQSVPQLKSSLDQASAATEKTNVQLHLAKAEFERQHELFERKVIAQAALDRYTRNLEAAEHAVAAAKAAEERARLAYQSNIGSENTAVAQVRQLLAQAKYNLQEAVVRAPCDGYVTNLQLVPGAIVSAAASVMPFVCERDEHNSGVVVASFMQGPYLQIQPGDYAEVVLPMYPGRVFPGKVLTTIDIASEGQLTASGLFPGIGNPNNNARFAVRIKLDDADSLRLPAGTQGSAAVYTGSMQIAGVIRMALMRASSWTNYLFFTA